MMVRGTAGMDQTSLPPVRLGTADSGSFSATMETARVLTSFATATRTVMMGQMKTLCCVVGYVYLLLTDTSDTSLYCLLSCVTLLFLYFLPFSYTPV